MTLARPLRLTLLGLLLLTGALAALVYGLSWHPAPRQDAAIDCQAQAATLQPGQALKVMTWNLQQPLAKGGAAPLDAVVQVLHDEQADIVLLQELHDGDTASGHRDQLALLQERLGDLYPCSTEAFYWKAPQPRVFGSVAIKLAILSRYRIARAERLQLPRRSANPIGRAFDRQPALLVGYLPIRGGGSLAALTTHLDAFIEGERSQAKQLTKTASLLDQLQADHRLWLLGGDFNTQPEHQRQPSIAQSELQRLAERYPTIPSPQQADKTRDYLLHSPALTPLPDLARQDAVRRISAQPPLITRLLLPPLD